MTKNITLKSTGTTVETLPDWAESFAGFRFTLTAPSGASANSEITQETTWVFGDAAPGKYVASMVPVDAQGRALWPAVVVEVDVPLDGDLPRTFLAPMGLSYSLS